MLMAPDALQSLALLPAAGKHNLSDVNVDVGAKPLFMQLILYQQNFIRNILVICFGRSPVKTISVHFDEVGLGCFSFQ